MVVLQKIKHTITMFPAILHLRYIPQKSEKRDSDIYVYIYTYIYIYIFMFIAALFIHDS